MCTEEAIREKYLRFEGFLDERTKRLWAANEAVAFGRGGTAAVARALNMALNTVKKGLLELEAPRRLDRRRIRAPGGGRKKSTESQSGLHSALEQLIEPLTRGDQSSALRWTCQSIRKLTDTLKSQGYKASTWLIHKALHDMKYNFNGNKKILEEENNQLRNEQFEFINYNANLMLKLYNPVIYIGTKKKEILGNFLNQDKERETQHEETKINSHDSFNHKLDRENQYNRYGHGKNTGFIGIRTNHDSAAFAIAVIKPWWYEVGYELYKECTELLITVDSGGSNSSRSRLWKWEIFQLANELQIPISVSHFPTGTSKWNNIEHRLFSLISLNRQGKSLVDYETMVSLIRNTNIKKDLKIKYGLEPSNYELKTKISNYNYNFNFNNIIIKENNFQGKWNYTIYPYNTEYL
ncbi:MAG: ISAzo13 family transposase [Deltaproteobacteria bacterium]|jgi:hypothetical protein|nr:ISAzo13 family transposase [Deltaproteobacteria bacterium]